MVIIMFIIILASFLVFDMTTGGQRLKRYKKTGLDAFVHRTVDELCQLNFWVICRWDG